MKTTYQQMMRDVIDTVNSINVEPQTVENAKLRVLIVIAHELRDLNDHIEYLSDRVISVETELASMSTTMERLTRFKGE